MRGMETGRPSKGFEKRRRRSAMRGLGVSGKVDRISWRAQDKLYCPDLGFHWATRACDCRSFTVSENRERELSMLRLKGGLEKRLLRRVQPIDGSRISLNSCCDPKSDMNKADPNALKCPVSWELSVRLVHDQFICLLLQITRTELKLPSNKASQCQDIGGPVGFLGRFNALEHPCSACVVWCYSTN